VVVVLVVVVDVAHQRWPPVSGLGVHGTVVVVEATVVVVVVADVGHQRWWTMTTLRVHGTVVVVVEVGATVVVVVPAIAVVVPPLPRWWCRGRGPQQELPEPS
jgi:hypothetical protein